MYVKEPNSGCSDIQLSLNNLVDCMEFSLIPVAFPHRCTVVVTEPVFSGKADSKCSGSARRAAV